MSINYTHSSVNALFHTVNNKLAILSEWFKVNKLLLNVSKINYVLFYPRTIQRPTIKYNLKIGSEVIPQRKDVKFLGFLLVEIDLEWETYINYIGMKISISLYVLSSLKNLIFTCDLWGTAQKGTLRKVITEKDYQMCGQSQI